MFVPCVITFFFYSAATLLIHIAMLNLSTAYPKMKHSQQWRITFRLVRCIAGLKGAFGFFYALIEKDNLGVINRSWVSELMFTSYCGYIIFEILLLYLTYRSITAFFTEPALRLLLVHHFVAGVAAYTLATSSNPRPHFIGTLNFGNECVVISYSMIVVFRKFGLNNHWFVEFNVKSLPIQYAARQILFFYTFYYLIVNMDSLLTCGLFFYCCFTAGAVFFTFVLNPYWLYETIIDAAEYHREKNK